MRCQYFPASLGLPGVSPLTSSGSDWYLSTDNCNLGVMLRHRCFRKVNGRERGDGPVHEYRGRPISAPWCWQDRGCSSTSGGDQALTDVVSGKNEEEEKEMCFGFGLASH